MASATLTVTDKLKINLIFLLSSKEGPLQRYMHVFWIMHKVQEKFVSGTLSVLITFKKLHYVTKDGLPSSTFDVVLLEENSKMMQQ